MYRKYFKTILDRVIGFLLLVILSPLMLAVIILLALFQEGNIFFIQERPGFLGRKFKLIKFTSMLPDQNSRMAVTKIGHVIRKTSIDELPQLINVLSGDMSLVGPRPLLLEYMSLYSVEQRRRHNVLPGITGWAQVNGRTSISWKEKFKLDLYYVEKYSFKLDCIILLKTIGMILHPKQNLPDEKFNGNN